MNADTDYQRRLILVRHAKSSWHDSTLKDHDRPLNKRGRRDAPEMANRLARRDLRPDLILSSSATRALQTARVLAETLMPGHPGPEVDRSLYLASPKRLMRAVQALDDRFELVLLVAHNPGLTELINRLTKPFLDNLPTCGYAEFGFAGPSWGLAEPETATLLSLDFPKNISPILS